MTTPKLRILVIEPETSCAEQLRTILADRAFAEVLIASNGDAACAVLRQETPDLVLLSAVYPPRDEEQVVSLLKWLDPFDRVPVLSIPPATRGFEDEPNPSDARACSPG
jgi:DNA-binding response OmpR family regulator